MSKENNSLIMTKYKVFNHFVYNEAMVADAKSKVETLQKYLVGIYYIALSSSFHANGAFNFYAKDEFLHSTI